MPPRGETRRGLILKEKVTAAAAEKKVDWEEEEEEEEEEENRATLMMTAEHVGARKRTQSTAGARARLGKPEIRASMLRLRWRYPSLLGTLGASRYPLACPDQTEGGMVKQSMILMLLTRPFMCLLEPSLSMAYRSV